MTDDYLKIAPLHNITISNGEKTLLTIKPNGKIIFNKVDFPGFTEDDFSREFVKIVEEEIIPTSWNITKT